MDQEARRQRVATLTKWGLGLVGAVVISPFVFLAVKGLVGLILAAAIGFVAIELAPVFGMKVANWKVKLIVQEAANNPIETMENLRIEKAQELETADQNIAEFETEIGNFDDKLAGFKREYPAEANRYEQISEKMHEGLTDMKREQDAARRALKDFEAKIKKARAIYSMALAAQKVVKLSKSAEARVFAQIKEEVAFESVSKELNRAFANLNLALERRASARTALPGADQTALPEARTSETIDVTPTSRESAPVRRTRKES